MMFSTRFLASALLAAGLSLPAASALACEGDNDAPEASAPAAPKPGEKVAQLAIDGMHCAGCAGHVRGALGKLAGVSHVDADFSKGTVTVIFNPKKTTIEKIRTTLAKAGFPEKTA